MTTLIELLRYAATISDMGRKPDPKALYRQAADTIEELQAEVERLTVDRNLEKKLRKDSDERAHDAETEIDALRAELDALKAQEPVGFISQYELTMLEQGYPQTIVMLKGAKRDIALYSGAAPQIPAPEQIEEAWRAGWAACRDAEYVGQEAEDEAWGMSQTCANADWESAAPQAPAPIEAQGEIVAWMHLEMGTCFSAAQWAVKNSNDPLAKQFVPLCVAQSTLEKCTDERMCSACFSNQGACENAAPQAPAPEASNSGAVMQDGSIASNVYEAFEAGLKFGMAHERKECAKACETTISPKPQYQWWNECAKTIAGVIRARGNDGN